MQALDKYFPYRSAGDDFTESNPVFAYYFYKYFLDAATNISKSVENAAERQ